MVVRALIGIKGKGILDRITVLRQFNPDLVKSSLEATGKIVKTAVENSELTQEPPKVPFTHFKTPKQRRWFWAAVGRGDITLPYQRRGLWNNWDVTVSVRRNNVVLRVENLSNVGQFAYGPHQQPFLVHWPLLKRNKRDRSGFKEFDKLATKTFKEKYLLGLNITVFGRVR